MQNMIVLYNNLRLEHFQVAVQGILTTYLALYMTNDKNGNKYIYSIYIAIMATYRIQTTISLKLRKLQC